MINPKEIYLCLDQVLSQIKFQEVTYEQNDKRSDSIYSKRIRAGKRRTYFFDVRATRGNDYYLTITESRKRFTGEGYDRHKIFLYKEDFNKFIKGLNEAVDYVKTELMPDFDFDAFSHEDEGFAGDEDRTEQNSASEVVNDNPAPASDTGTTGSIGVNDEDVDKW